MPSNAFSAIGLIPLEPYEITYKNEIIENTRNNFARSRDQVETDIKKWSSLEFVSSNTSTKIKPKTEYWETICSRCNKPTLVPFMPDPSKPVYCNECFEIIKNNRNKEVKEKTIIQTDKEYISKKEKIETDKTIEERRKEIKDKIDKSGLADTIRNIFKE